MLKNVLIVGATYSYALYASCKSCKSHMRVSNCPQQIIVRCVSYLKITIQLIKEAEICNHLLYVSSENEI